ncbi:hypothetical protein ACSBR2_031744 [Camellia fascicularis]
MNVGASTMSTNISMPRNFTLGLVGYTCGDPVEVVPSKFIEDNGWRQTQALATYNVTCSYSQFRASPTPTCMFPCLHSIMKPLFHALFVVVSAKDNLKQNV